MFKPAKKLNSRAAFKAFEAALKGKALGRWTGFGSSNAKTTQVACTADNRIVATASEENGCVFDVISGKRLLCRHFPHRRGNISTIGVSISHSGDKIAFLSCFLSILDGPNWSQQQDIKFDQLPVWGSLVSDFDRNWHAIGFRDNVVRVYEATGRPLAELAGHGSWPNCLSLSGDGSYLASIDSKTGVLVWKTSDWSLAVSIPAAFGQFISFDPTENRFATIRERGSIGDEKESGFLKIWSVPDGKLTKELYFSGIALTSARFSPDGKFIACGMSDPDGNSAALIEAETGRIVRRLKGPCASFDDFAFMSIRNAIAVAGGWSEKQLVIWELADAESAENQVANIDGNPDGVSLD